MDEKLSFGIIGSGIYGQVHARVYENDPRVTLKALWSPTRSHREAAAHRFGCDTSETWEDIIENRSIDCIAVVITDFAHTEYTVSALNAGKHVIVEKPMAMSGNECRKIISARIQAGRS